MRHFPKSPVELLKPRTFFAIAILFFLVLAQHGAQAATLRRPVSPNQPMFQIHIDTWNTADPQKIIDLIPEDIRPYVVMTISLSINHDATTGQWKTIEYGYETAKSWIRTCAQNRMWAMIQPSSGGFSHFKDYDTTVNLDTTVYGEFFRDYPNFLGINYAEQFWGFDDKWSVTWQQRVNHWTNLMKLTNKYGGYLAVSFTGGYYGAGLNSVAMVKRNPAFAAALRKYPENFIMEEKFTMAYGFHDIESTSMGMWLSGYAAQYGIRFDQCGWVPNASEDFPVASGAIPFLEHIMMTGETVYDGPELIWQQCIKNLNDATTADGYTTRRWDLFPQYQNITMDVFRKIMDGTVRILSRKEVIDRAKLVIIDDATSGTDQVKYSSPQTLFDSLYLMPGDGTYMDNKSWFKKTGRYPAIPTVYQLADDTAKAFKVQVKQSTYATRWPTAAAKVAEFNTLFPQEYTGTIYATRHENGWMTYNPYKTGVTATGSIPLKYNTCDSVGVTYSQYSLGVIKEFSDKLNFYLSNYDNANTALKNDTIRIYGASAEPTYTYTDRASHQASSIAKSWSGGVLTLSITHNGPLDLVVSCSGSGTGRLTSYTTASVLAPSQPSVYTGPWQYEAENFDVKSIGGNVTSGIGNSVRKYTGMGFLKFGTSSSASIRDTVTVPTAGTYKLLTRYLASSGAVSTIDLYVNGTKVVTPKFAKTANDSIWAVDTQSLALKAGANVVMFKANATGSYGVNFDNVVLVSSASAKIAPKVTFVTPSKTASFTAAATISLEASASDSDGTVSHVDFYNGTTLLHSEWTAPYTYDWTGVAAGIYFLKAIATDNDGNTAQDTMTVTVKGGTVGISQGLVREVIVHQIFDLQGNRLGEVTTDGTVSLETAAARMGFRPGLYLARHATPQGMVTRKVDVGRP